MFTLLALEVVLTLWGMPTYFPSEPPPHDYKVLPWRTCDELGCHYDYEIAQAACADVTSRGRHCIVNRQGFSDRDEFVAQEDFASRTRLMTLGDSFTHGFSADVGKSYVETIETLLPEAILWNMGISGTGTTHALASFQGFAPQLNPQLTILGFFVNDFSDNMAPLNIRLAFKDSEGRQFFVRRFQFDRLGNPVELPIDEVAAYSAMGYQPPLTELERVTGLTRLGTLWLRLLDKLSIMYSDNLLESQRRLTVQYLTQLRDATIELDSALLVLLIPHREDIEEPGELYLLAIELMEELNLLYMNPIDLLDPVADYAPRPDPHWNNAGHQKIGIYMTQCIETFMASGQLADCENVVMP